MISNICQSFPHNFSLGVFLDKLRRDIFLLHLLQRLQELLLLAGSLRPLLLRLLHVVLRQRYRIVELLVLPLLDLQQVVVNVLARLELGRALFIVKLEFALRN